MRSATAFTLFARFLRGEDIAPQLAFIDAMGANTIRIFGQVAPDQGWPAWGDYARPFDRPDFDAQLAAFLDRVEGAGKRIEFTVCTYADDLGTQRAYCQRVINVLAARRVGHLVELYNEAENGHGDPAIVNGLDRQGVLCAGGWQTPIADPHDPSHLYIPCALDYLTTHTDRGDQWPRKAKDALDLRDGWTTPDGQTFAGFKGPIVLDEPIGVDETNQPGHRSNVVSDYAAYHGVSCLYGAGSNYFSQTLGIDGLVPPAGSIQEQTAFAVRDVWNTIPLDAMNGAYTHDGFTDLAVAWRVDQDGLRCYGSIVGSEQWDVPVRPIESWTPVGANGYTVEQMGAAIRGVR